MEIRAVRTEHDRLTVPMTQQRKGNVRAYLIEKQPRREDRDLQPFPSVELFDRNDDGTVNAEDAVLLKELPAAAPAGQTKAAEESEAAHPHLNAWV